MTEVAVMTPDTFVLPANVVSKKDISRLVSELEWVDNEMTAAVVREKAGGEATAQPALSAQLNAFMDANALSLENSNGRTDLIKQLRHLKDQVPILHMTFAVVADSESVHQLTDWVRTNIHPQVVLDISLQPALVAGVYLRTPNHIHDMSMRAKLDGSRAQLVEQLEALRVGK